MSFADFEYANLQNLKVVQASLKSQTVGFSMHELCRFADLFSISPAQNTRFFHWVEQHHEELISQAPYS